MPEVKDVYHDNPEKQAELDQLRAQADELGIKYHHRAGIPRLQELLRTYKAHPVQGVAESVETDAQMVQNKRPMPDFMTEAEFQKRFGKSPAQEANRLIRCRVQCMNPVKKEWPGEIISVGNAKIGTFKKYIPYNNEPYHIPKIIFDHMKEKKCVTFVAENVRRSDGSMERTRKPKLIKEYAIEELPALTQQELKELAQQQAMREGNTAALG